MTLTAAGYNGHNKGGVRLSKLSLRIRAALMAAVLCVTSQWAIQMGDVPMTLQTFFIALCGALLGPLWGAAAALVYLLIGAVGVPVFSGFQAGIGWLVGPTGGFLWAFPIMALLCALRGKAPAWQQIGCALAGLVILYVMGTAQFMLVTGRGLLESLLLAVLRFVVKDVVCVVLGVLLGRIIKRRLSHA